jgi:hypothetical protein
MTSPNPVAAPMCKAIAREMMAALDQFNEWAESIGMSSERIELERHELTSAAMAFNEAPDDTLHVIVIGGTIRQAKDFAGRFGFDSTAVYVGRADSLRGRTLRASIVVRCGNWWERHDIQEIERNLAIMGATQ